MRKRIEAMSDKKHHLAPLQLEIMQILWQRDEATVAEVHQALTDDRSLAYTTISTMLTKMEKNGQVRIKERRAGRVIVYAPVLQEADVSKSMIGDLASRLFRDDLTELMHHLLDERDVSRDELERLEALIQERKQQ